MTSLPSQALAGQLACLGAASLWAVAVLIFREPIARYGSRTVNLVKCGTAALLQGATIFALGLDGPLWDAPGRSLALVAASGLIGLVIGDTALFGAVARIGAHTTLLLQTLAPLFAALVAWLWLGEVPAARAGLGATVILAGVVLVVAPSRETVTDELSLQDRARRWTGIAFAALAALGQGAGIVVAKAGMVDVPFVPATFLRLATAAAGLLLVSALARRLRPAREALRDRSAMKRILPATLLGTYLALFLMMAGVAMASAAVSAVLLSTSPIFGLFLEARIDGRPVRLRGLVGTVVAVAGVAIVTWHGG